MSCHLLLLQNYKGLSPRTRHLWIKICQTAYLNKAIACLCIQNIVTSENLLHIQKFTINYKHGLFLKHPYSKKTTPHKPPLYSFFSTNAARGVIFCFVPLLVARHAAGAAGAGDGAGLLVFPGRITKEDLRKQVSELRFERSSPKGFELRQKV